MISRNVEGGMIQIDRETVAVKIDMGAMNAIVESDEDHLTRTTMAQNDQARVFTPKILKLYKSVLDTLDKDLTMMKSMVVVGTVGEILMEVEIGTIDTIIMIITEAITIIR